MGWRTIISKEILDIPVLGCIAVHESLLPQYRGFAPINWAIVNGEEETGVTLFFMNKDMDNGDIIAQRKIKIGFNDYAWDIYQKTIFSSLDLLKEYLPLIKNKKAPRKTQDERSATFTCKRLPNDGRINWNNSTYDIYNFIRGLSYPYPGAFSYLDTKKVIIWKASIPKQRIYVGHVAGRVIKIIQNKGVEVLTKDGIILIEEIQIDQDKKIKASEIINSISTTFESC